MNREDLYTCDVIMREPVWT